MCDNNETHFLYFAYGSNLLVKRIQINNPSAEFVGIGKLMDHQLGFIRQTTTWNGAAATIIPYENDYVWGAIWKIKLEDLENLDNQEGVTDGWYFPKEVSIKNSEGQELLCRTYQQAVNPEPLEDITQILAENKPSETYLRVILAGANNIHLPDDYIDKLKRIPHNGRKASPELLKLLGDL